MPKMSKKLKIAFMGGNQAGIIGALSVLSSGHIITAAVSYSRDLKRILKFLGLPCYASIKSRGFQRSLKGSDLLLSVHGREIVRGEILEMPRMAAVNIHPYLYCYKGAHPVGRALKERNFRASVGVHLMTSKIDEGKVLREEFMNVEPAASEEEIYNKLYPLYGNVVLWLMKRYCLNK